ncbi:Cell wall / vacuolar inhibitor of fructosidase 1 [Bienertia sinuspersici]
MHAFILYIALFFAFTSSVPTQCNGMMRKSNSETALVLTCRKTTDFGFCVFLLRSDPRSAGASVDGLAHIALEKLGSHAKVTSNYLQSLHKSCSAKERVVTATCINLYGRALNGHVPSAIKYLNGKNYEEAIKAASAAMNDGGGCQGVINKNPSPKWQMQSQKNEYMHDVSLLCSDLIRLLR